MDAGYIKNEIVDILSKKIGIKREILINMDPYMSLLDAAVGVKPRDLLTLFFDLQQKYGISFKEHDIVDRRFDRIDNIVKSIIERKSESEQ